MELVRIPKPDNKTNNKKKESKELSYDEIIKQTLEGKDLQDTFSDFIQMRAFIKKPITTNKALVRMINRLKKFAGDDVELATAILDQSIRNNWQDIYPLKDLNKKAGGKPTAVSKKFSGNTLKDAEGKDIVF